VETIRGARRWFLLILGAIGVAFGGGDAVAAKVKVPISELRPPQPTAPESLAYYVDDLPYRVAPGDQLTVDFGAALEGRPLRAEHLLVRPDGMITLNPIGDVRAAGRTPGELDSVLTEKYVNVFREPNITVTVEKLAGNFVHVLGSVRSPGSFEVMPNATVLQAVARAGGATNDASLGNVILMRRTGPSSLVVRKVQLNRAISQGLAAQDPYLRRFDIVYVPKSTIANVNQFVTQFFGPMRTVSEAYIFGWEAFHIDRVFPEGDVEVRPR
jgi:protein involved in polysaccharide export with SLBB domain